MRLDRTIATGVVLLGLSVAGCGGGNDNNAREVGRRSIVERPEPPTAALITDKDLDRQPPGSAARSMLEFWSSLQWQSWGEAVGYYLPELRQAIGTASMIEALKYQAPYFRSTKPRLSTPSRAGQDVVIRYQTVDTGGREVTSSTTWQRFGTDWRMVYDAGLDTALRGWAQSRVQQSVDPTAREAHPRAIRAGIEAAERQSKFLERLLAERRQRSER